MDITTFLVAYFLAQKCEYEAIIKKHQSIIGNVINTNLDLYEKIAELEQIIFELRRNRP